MQAADQLGDDADLIGDANSYSCPRGIGPGYATILGTQSTVTQWQSLSTPQPLVLGCGQSQVSASQMVYLTAEQVVYGAAGDPNALYRCTLADVRYLMLRSTFTKAYNLRSLAVPTAEYWADSENPTAATLYGGGAGPGVGPWAWETMLANVWTQLSLVPAMTAPSVNSALFPEQNPERFRFIEDSPLAAFQQALASVFFSLVYKPTQGGSFSIVPLGAIDGTFTTLQTASASSLLDATNPIDSNSTWFPASLDVMFLAVYSGTPEQQLTEGPYYVLSVTPTTYPGGVTPMPGTTDVIYAPLDAQMPCGGIPASIQWTATMAYALGTLVDGDNGHTYIATTAGTSGGTQPVWPTGTGATIADGSVVWQEQTTYPTNYASMQTLATYLVAAYLQARDQAMRAKVFTYDGIIGFLPGSLVENVTWRLNADGATTVVSAVE